MKKNIKIVEVGPRDGLQNESQVLDTSFKVDFIRNLIDSGLNSIEVTSFVRPDKIPQMADCQKLFKEIQSSSANKAQLIALVPNLKGLEIAKSLDVKEIAIFTATSDTFNKKNINATVKESILRIKPVIEDAVKSGMKVRGYISTVFGCPYEGSTSLESLREISNELLSFGVSELSLGDTIGVANPLQVKEVINCIKSDVDLDKVAMHFHDTRGLALANIYSSYEEGINIFDASAGGLGGCPYAHGATGNVATEDVVNLFHSMGITTGVDMNKLILSSSKVLKKLNKQSPSKFYDFAIKNLSEV